MTTNRRHTVYLLFFSLIFCSIAHSKKIQKKDIRLVMPKITDGTIEIEKVEHHKAINALQITLKTTRLKKEKNETYYSCSVRDTAKNSLQELDTFSLPKDIGIKERQTIPVSSLPDDLKLPIIITFKEKYICSGGECIEIAD